MIMKNNYLYKKKNYIINLIFLLFWIGGILSFLVKNDVFTENNWAGGVFLYLASFIILINHKKNNIFILIYIGLFGFLIEIIGSSYHLPFGEYYYTSELGIGLYDVPFSLFSAWIIISVFVIQILHYSNVSKKLWWLMGPVLMIIVDLIIEPVATGPMNAWVWIDEGLYYGVPISNFIGWGIVSLPIFIVIQKFYKDEYKQSIIPIAVISFFVIVSIIKSLLLPIIIFIMICVFVIVRKKINA
ncbi:MAG: hypothetical protein CL774_03390 [Chloroflexi bacterium]|nr:hypothetical protein [Chloroflexota bacterium]